MSDELERARRDFLAFVEQHDDEPSFGYRLDTWQAWPACDGEHDESRFPRCSNPGLALELDSTEPAYPFAIRLGPWVLLRGRAIEHTWEQLPRVARALQYHEVHLHELTAPCHPSCVLCDVYEEEEVT